MAVRERVGWAVGGWDPLSEGEGVPPPPLVPWDKNIRRLEGRFRKPYQTCRGIEGPDRPPWDSRVQRPSGSMVRAVISRTQPVLANPWWVWTHIPIRFVTGGGGGGKRPAVNNDFARCFFLYLKFSQPHWSSLRCMAQYAVACLVFLKTIEIEKYANAQNANAPAASPSSNKRVRREETERKL